MKKIVLTVAAVIAFAAAAQATIVGSKHDLGTTNASIRGVYTPTGPTEICVYCHTPHNPTRNVPLWNRNNPTAAGWSFYQSPTLSPAAQGAAFSADSVSLFCMSCHDGVTGLGDIKNLKTVVGNAINLSPAGYANIGGGTGVGGTGGNSLTNDHPVGFSYDTAQGIDAGLKAKSAVNTALGYNGQGVFFGPGADLMECASCHKVHEPGTSGHFLRKENNLSALCLDCHAK